MACWNRVGCSGCETCQLVKLELHFPEITFAAWFQVSMGHNRYFVYLLKCKRWSWLCYAEKFYAEYLVLQVMNIATDLLTHWVMWVGFSFCYRSSGPMDLFLWHFQVIGHGIQPWGNSSQDMSFSLSCWVSAFIFFGSWYRYLSLQWTLILQITWNLMMEPGRQQESDTDYSSSLDLPFALSLPYFTFTFPS